MKLITIEEHITDQEILEEAKKIQNQQNDFDKNEKKRFLGDNSFIGNILTDTENYRIPYMDKEKIDMQILSFINPMNEADIPNNIKTKNTIKANDFLNSKINEHPDRFAAFATLPLWDVDASVKEFERTVKELGFKGALVTGKIDGHFLDEKCFIPVFQKAEELDVPIYFHPSMPIDEILDYYYTSKEGDWSTLVALRYGSAGFGWHLDIGIQMVRMILSGIFDKLPNLKLVTGHWGEGMISMLDRLDYMLPQKITGLKKNISDYYKDNIYITPSGIKSQINLEATVKYLGADHIIWSVDYPYIRDTGLTDFLFNSNLTKEQKELISHKNAEKLFKIS